METEHMAVKIMGVSYSGVCMCVCVYEYVQIPSWINFIFIIKIIVITLMPIAKKSSVQNLYKKISICWACFFGWKCQSVIS